MSLLAIYQSKPKLLDGDEPEVAQPLGLHFHDGRAMAVALHSHCSTIGLRTERASERDSDHKMALAGVGAEIVVSLIVARTVPRADQFEMRTGGGQGAPHSRCVILLAYSRSLFESFKQATVLNFRPKRDAQLAPE